MTVIRTKELTKRFRSVSALNRVSLDVQEGAVYALVGPNGAGKATAIKILMNLIAATCGQAETQVPARDLASGSGLDRIRIGRFPRRFR
jgi:ABC-type multidrug transport system ATPase subunit